MKCCSRSNAVHVSTWNRAPRAGRHQGAGGSCVGSFLGAGGGAGVTGFWGCRLGPEPGEAGGAGAAGGTGVMLGGGTGVLLGGGSGVVLGGGAGVVLGGGMGAGAGGGVGAGATGGTGTVEPGGAPGGGMGAGPVGDATGNGSGVVQSCHDDVSLSVCGRRQQAAARRSGGQAVGCMAVRTSFHRKARRAAA
jgi:hypothetical protein